MNKVTIICVALLLVLAPGSALACLDVDDLLDVNCDGTVSVVLFGDSITYGVGDELGIGYPGRLQLMFPNVEIINLGLPGESTALGKLRAAAQFAQIQLADFVITLEGVNDYFLASPSPAITKSNLLEIQTSGASIGALSILATLTEVGRSFQRDWVLSVNNRLKPIARVDFFSLGPEIIGGDMLHPSGDGYQAMAELVALELLLLSEENRPVDTDGDGIYDYAEPWFGTGVNVPDTDGDGLLDGAEVFTHGSSPLLLDSDNDGYGDFQEVTVIGSNPGDARPGPPTITSIEVIP